MHKLLTILPLILIAFGGTAYGIATAPRVQVAEADAGAPVCGPNVYAISSHGSASVCMTGAAIVRALAFDQVNAPCAEDAALIFADPDLDAVAARAGRMVCINLDDLLSDNIRGAGASSRQCARIGALPSALGCRF